jgi:hypothetical protein
MLSAVALIAAAPFPTNSAGNLDLDWVVSGQLFFSFISKLSYGVLQKNERQASPFPGIGSD